MQRKKSKKAADKQRREFLSDFVTTRFRSIYEILEGCITLTEEDKSLIMAGGDHFMYFKIHLEFPTDSYSDFVGKWAGAGKPYAIDTSSLSPEIRIVLIPYPVYDNALDEKDKEEFDGTDAEWEEYKKKFEEKTPQTVIFFLDNSPKVLENTPELVANWLFATTLATASISGKYPADEEDRSPEFQRCLADSAMLVGRYLSSLSEEAFEALPQYIQVLKGISEEEALQFGRNHIEYCTELATSIQDESWRSKKLGEWEEAVAGGGTYHHCELRNLPLRDKPDDNPIPAEPWREYCLNNWGYKGRIFGRYDLETGDTKMLVDYLLESTQMPNPRYGFFTSVEIIEETSSGYQQIILGRVVEPSKLFYLEMMLLGGLTREDGTKLTKDEVREVVKDWMQPVILAGIFDFQNPESRRLLDQLVNDPATKEDVGYVLKDAMDLADSGRLITLDKWENRSEKDQIEESETA